MSVSSMPLVTVGFINYAQKEGYSSSAYLVTFLDSLIAQSYPHMEILCLDNASTDEGQSLEMIARYPQVRIIKNTRNEGFVAHNRLLGEARGAYYLCTNFDILLEKDFVATLVEAAERTPQGGSFGGTSYRWDVAKKQCTEVLDTTGLLMTKSHHVRDREMGERLSFDDCALRIPQEVFGVSGVSVLYRMQALEEVRDATGAYFDPHFFMYKEDVDLAYRLRWAGWTAYYVPQARLWHDRTLGETVSSAFRVLRILRNRAHKGRMNRVLSIRNHLFLLYKNFSWSYSWHIILSTLWDEGRKFLWVLLFESFALEAYGEFWKRRGELQTVLRKVGEKDMERWLLG